MPKLDWSVRDPSARPPRAVLAPDRDGAADRRELEIGRALRRDDAHALGGSVAGSPRWKAPIEITGIAERAMG